MSKQDIRDSGVSTDLERSEHLLEMYSIKAFLGIVSPYQSTYVNILSSDDSILDSEKLS